jgi:hypothetical protein
LIDQTTSSTTSIEMGQGGMGPGIFVWALLDWDAVIRQWRGLFLGQGGNPIQRVTQHVMEEFLFSQSVDL